MESRQLLAATWSAQDVLIGLDQVTQNFPTLTGTGETVAMIDRGTDYNHPELGAGFGPGHKIIDGYDFRDSTGDVFPYDGDAHGTGTAGQIAADPHFVNGELYQGVAPGVNLVTLKANSAADIKDAFDWIVQHRTQYNIVAVNYVDFAGYDASPFTWELQSLRNDGVFVAGPAGNFGPTTQARPYPDHLIYLVGSVDLNDQMSAFSNVGPAVDLVAPGGGVNISWYQNGQHTDTIADGTSWAAPQVVGAAALIKQVNPAFTPSMILSILQDSAHWVWDANSGRSYPRLDVNEAIKVAFQRSSAFQSLPPPVPQPQPQPQPAPQPAPDPGPQPQPLPQPAPQPDPVPPPVPQPPIPGKSQPPSQPATDTGTPQAAHRHRWYHVSRHNRQKRLWARLRHHFHS